MEQQRDPESDTTIRVKRPVYHQPTPDDPSAIIVDVEQHEHTIDVTFDVLHTRETFTRTFSLDTQSILPHITVLQDAAATHGDGPYNIEYAEVKITSTGQEWRIDGVAFDDETTWLTAGKLAANGVVVSAILTVALAATYSLSDSLLVAGIAAIPVVVAWVVTLRAWHSARKNGEL